MADTVRIEIKDKYGIPFLVKYRTFRIKNLRMFENFAFHDEHGVICTPAQLSWLEDAITYG